MAMSLNKDISQKILQSLVNLPNSASMSSNITASRYHQTHRATINATSTTTSNFPPVPQPVATSSTTTVTTDNNGDKIFELGDTKSLFASVPTIKLMHSAATLNVTAVEPLVDLSIWMMNSPLMKTGLVRNAVMGTIKHTVYNHFVAGGDTVETGRTVKRLWDSGLRGMLDYGLEHANDNESCDKATQQLIKTAESTQSLPHSSVSFVVVKITAICPVYLLRRVSDLLRWEYNNSSFKLPWKQQTLPIFSTNSPFYHTLQQPTPLTVDEEHDLELAHQRLQTICDKSFEGNVPVVIDAEDTLIQPAIDYMTYWASVKYNKVERPMVFGTIQAYLKDAGERMVLTKKEADKMGFAVGFKLVRGAYMSSKRKLAHLLGVESPIHNIINDTHDCFNGCAMFMLEEVSNRAGGLILATHNLDSGKLVARKAKEYGITKDSQKLEFASLYGMAEAMTFGLRNAGFSVSKYLPFGPVDQIMPYLLRRAEENKGLLSSSNLDRQLMMKELKRRKKAFFGQGVTENENHFKPEANSMTN